MLTRLPAAAFVLLLGLVAPRLLQGQTPLTLLGHGSMDTVLVTAYEDEVQASPTVLQAEWTGLDGTGTAPRFRLTWLGQPVVGQQVELIDLIMAGVDQYLDQRIHFTRDGVKTSLPVGAIMAGVGRVISAPVEAIGAPEVVLSEATRKQLERVCSIDWSQAHFGVDGGDDQEKYMAIYYYVRAQRMELERNLHDDLVPLSGLLLRPAWEMIADDPSRDVAVPTICTSVLDDDDYLCALDLQAESGPVLPDVRLTDTMFQEIALAAEAHGPREPGPKVRKRDRWLKAELDAINRRIDQSDQRKELWALRDRLDDMEGRLDDLGLQVDELNREREKARASENPVAGLSALTGRNLQVRFAVGSAELDGHARALLAEVVQAMAMAPAERLLVTGRADPSGDPAANLALSERRAKAVRSFLLSHGIGGDRVLLNYYGSAQSTGNGAAERRVDLEWLR